jgi:hypothetical protein
MIRRRTKFRIPSSVGFLVIVIKSKAKENFRMAVILLVYILNNGMEALCYKPEGRGFNSRRGHCIFQLT